MIGNIKLYIILALSFVCMAGTPGCVSKVAIMDVMAPLPTISAIVINSLPGGAKKKSLNGREYTSGYFKPDDMDENAEDDRLRSYAIVTILGERRPYSIDVRVFREVRERHEGVTTYRVLGQDRRIADKLIKTIREALANRPEDRNIIDDFRVF